MPTAKIDSGGGPLGMAPWIWETAWARTVKWDFAYCGPVERELAERFPKAYRASAEYYKMLDRIERGERA